MFSRAPSTLSLRTPGIPNTGPLTHGENQPIAVGHAHRPLADDRQTTHGIILPLEVGNHPTSNGISNADLHLKFKYFKADESSKKCGLGSGLRVYRIRFVDIVIMVR